MKYFAGFIIMPVILAHIGVLHAAPTLQVTTYSIPGSLCFSGIDYSTMLKCVGADSGWVQSPLYAYNPCDKAVAANNYACLLGVVDNTFYICETDTAGETLQNLGACTYCASMQRNGYSDWESIGSNRVRRSYNYYNYTTSDYYTCTETIRSSTYEYGCAAGYHTKSATASATMTCEKCPLSGTSKIGNTKITGCYLPSGSFSDDSGSGTLSGDCYWTEN